MNQNVKIIDVLVCLNHGNGDACCRFLLTRGTGTGVEHTCKRRDCDNHDGQKIIPNHPPLEQK